MNVAIIGDSSRLFMPYVDSYEKILKKNKVNYTLIQWDRYKTDDLKCEFIYRDKKNGHKKNIIDYIKYCMFVKEKLKDVEYDLIILCGIPITFLLSFYIQYFNKGKYIIDIRDYHKILRFISIKKAIKHSVITVLSSPGFKEWLPKDYNYLINHNTQVKSMSILKEVKKCNSNEKINISYIGAIRDYRVNIDLINSVKNNSRFDLFFHGDGEINKDIEIFIKEHKIRNVYITGRYHKEDENKFYQSSDLINVIVPNEEINSKTLLPNRLYNAVLFGKPLLTLRGTYLADQIEKYKLGIVLASLNNIEQDIFRYLTTFDKKEYEDGRLNFIKDISKDNNEFQSIIEKFITEILQKGTSLNLR